MEGSEAPRWNAIDRNKSLSCSTHSKLLNATAAKMATKVNKELSIHALLATL